MLSRTNVPIVLKNPKIPVLQLKTIDKVVNSSYIIKLFKFCYFIFHEERPAKYLFGSIEETNLIKYN